MARKRPKSPDSYSLIDEALQRFANPESESHRRVRRALLELRTLSATLDQFYEGKASASQREDDHYAASERKMALEALAAQKDLTAQTKRLTSNPSTIALSEAYLTFAERQVEVTESVIEARGALTAQANSMDAHFRKMKNDLIELSIAGLSDDISLNAALTLVSGGLIAAGVLGGPYTAVAAAVGSAALLAKDIRDRLIRSRQTKGQDRDAARVEAAINLMRVVAQMIRDWLDLLRAPRE